MRGCHSRLDQTLLAVPAFLTGPRFVCVSLAGLRSSWRATSGSPHGRCATSLAYTPRRSGNEFRKAIFQFLDTDFRCIHADRNLFHCLPYGNSVEEVGYV